MTFEKIDGRGYRFSHDVCAIENLETSLSCTRPSSLSPAAARACLNVSAHYSTIISGLLVKSRLRAVLEMFRSLSTCLSSLII